MAMAHHLRMAPQGSLVGSIKFDAVTKLVDKLSEDLESARLSTQQRDAALEELKVHGRDPRNSDPIFTKKGIETLTRHAFNEPSSTTSRNALRVLCNALLLKPDTRQLFVSLGQEDKACSQLRNDSREDEFLVARLLLLTTYDTTINLVKLVDEHHLGDAIIENISRHADRVSETTVSRARADPMEEMALLETLKLLFNVTKLCPERVDSFTPAIAPLITLLCKLDISSTRTPLEPPLGSVVHAFMNMNLNSEDAKASLYPKSGSTSVADRLVYLLDIATRSYPDSDIDLSVSPLACTIASIYEHAPESVRQLIQSKLLPGEEDRQSVLGKGDTLPARLLRNSTNALAPRFREVILALFFNMSDKDASTFVNNVGYGYAAGFLFQNNILMPDSANEMQTAEGSGRPVNPITGQFIDVEKFADLPDMTGEEKEREAERLFVLFERLKKSGIISVQNPVEQAVQEGRFEELADDYEEDVAKHVD
ncbi:guanine nucleotide exchange factor [Lasiosphaeris hirsuta]|uniref:Guanine nucleotide exchange factor n=1 Tax=Lasiosphaeris hirsuta TaxID=260670 RepID=A0AA40BBV9_9PEZI|nr:guanine nucleotide exchange factor [Lasiosphaeris hirsuta]